MIALTTRLNERDETIIQLQEELEAYDRIHRETEEVLDVKDKRIIELEQALRENHIPVPKDKREDLVYFTKRLVCQIYCRIYKIQL